jgi:hypothetical protein
MKTGETKVIAERESGNYMSGESWPEYLVFKKLKKGQFHLNIMRNENIDDAHTYCSENDLIDDEGNLNLPDQIEGKNVFVNEGYIYTEDLVEDYDNALEIIFISPDEKIVADWFKENEWDYDDFIEKFVMEERGIAYPVISTIKESDLESISDPLDLGEPMSPEQAKRLREFAKIRKVDYANARNSTSEESTKNSTAKKTTTKKKSSKKKTTKKN